MKYTIDIPDEVKWGVVTCRTEDGFYTRDFDSLEELNSDYINEHFGDLQDTAYQKGFEDGKAVYEKGCEGCKYANVAGTHEPCVRCSNSYSNQWTAKDDKIEVGDEVIDKDGDKTIVTHIHGELFDGLCHDGSTMSDLFLEDVDRILEAMKHD